MKQTKMLVAALALFSLCGSAFASCTFSWDHVGSTQTFKQIKEQIGSKITADYCAKYNKNYEIVIVTDEYNSSERTLVHAAVGLRKRGTGSQLVKRMSAYRFESGNFVIAKKFEMSAALALDTLVDVMSAPEEFLN